MLALLPPGRLFHREASGALWNLLDGIAQEFARLEQRAHDLLDEFDPRTTSELLAEWEAQTGLPDECHGLGDTVAERRAELHAKLTAIGSCSRQFYIDVAERLGFAISIEEFSPSQPGPGGLGFSGTDWWFVWRVSAPSTTTTYIALAGIARAGDPLRDWGSQVLECVITALKPTHTRVIFSYYDVLPQAFVLASDSYMPEEPSDFTSWIGFAESAANT